MFVVSAAAVAVVPSILAAQAETDALVTPVDCVAAPLAGFSGVDHRPVALVVAVLAAVAACLLESQTATSSAAVKLFHLVCLLCGPLSASGLGMAAVAQCSNHLSGRASLPSRALVLRAAAERRELAAAPRHLIIA